MGIQHSHNVPPFLKWCAHTIPAVFDDSLTYYEALCALWKWLQENLVDVVNNNATVTEEYIKLTNDLKKFVDEYFDNLDVQEEINNKLDAMAEAGTLADIISQYLNSTAIFGFDTVADMQDAPNLTNGSFARTLGYHAKNDGGSALYKIRNITNDDFVDGMFIIEMGDEENQLIAELVYADKMSVAKFGIKNDGSRDETDNIQYLINKNVPIILDDGVYLIEGTLTGDMTIIGNSQKSIISGGETIHRVIDLSDGTADDKIYLDNLSFRNARVNLYQYEGDTLTYTDKANKLNVHAENLWFETLDGAAQGQFWGSFIKTPKPANYNRFESNAYACYPLEIVNNSGYNALMINNVCTDTNGNVQSVADNSAIGIVDKVHSSAPTVYVDLKAERHPFAVASDKTPASTKYPRRVFDVNQAGHIGIGTSCDNDDATFTGSYSIKIKDDYASIGLMKGTKALSMSADTDENLVFRRAGWDMVKMTKFGIGLPTVSSAYYLPNLATDGDFASVGATWIGVMKYVQDTKKIAYWNGTGWSDALGNLLKGF